MSHVKKLIIKCLSAIAAVLITAGMAIPVYAASDSVKVSLPVSQSFVNHTTLKAEDTFSYVLTPLEKGNPMPGQNSDRYSFNIKGTEKVKLAEISFTRTGIYRYELKQTVEKEKNGYTYDREAYTIEIHVTNTADGDLSAATIAHKGENGKTDQISFENTYRKEAGSAAPGSFPKTGDNSNPTFWLGLLAFGAAMIAGTLAVNKKRRSGK